MKVRKLLAVFMWSAILASCTNEKAQTIEDKKKELAKYKTELKATSVKIATLEKEIARLDTSFHIEQKTKLIQIAELKKQDFRHFIEVQGNVDAEENVTALNQQPGIVTAIYVNVGDKVKKGQLLGLTQTSAALEDQV